MKICPRCMRQFEDDVEVCPDDATRLRAFRDQTSQLIGTVLDGRWKIEEKIGEGGMGEVYRARQVNVDRVVAVKVLRLALASTEQYVTRFFREADIATSVQHPHFVTIYDFGQTHEDQLLYIAMELLDGEPMSTVMKRRRFDLLEALTIATQVCAALAAAHDARIVHRDLKPDNIFLIHVPEGGPFVKVLDFGIAKDLDSENKVTRTGQLFGTPEYMSPEQCEGGNRVDGRSDLYALGCIIYELLTGRSPCQRDSIIQTLLAQVGEEPKSFKTMGIPVPMGVEAIVMKLLEKHPDNRFSNALETRQALLDEIERLRSNSGEIHVYETVSAGIKPRDQTAQTVSYTDLGHPLQLEGILASSARSAVAKEAVKRRESDAERSTENLDARAAAKRPAILLAGVAIAMLAGIGYVASAGSTDETPLPAASKPITNETKRVTSTATEAATRASLEAATEAAARRHGSAVALSAATVALAPPPEIEPAPKPDRPQPAVGVGIRTQKSMNDRVMATQKALLACYNRREDTADGGDVTLVFEIEADGTLKSADATSSTFGSEAALGCMKRVAGRLRFFPAAQAARFEKTLGFHPPK